MIIEKVYELIISHYYSAKISYYVLIMYFLIKYYVSYTIRCYASY